MTLSREQQWENLYERLVEALAAFGKDGASGEAALK